MKRIAIIGAGITGVTTAYALLKRGCEVTVYERHPYAAMETSFANGGQLSVSNSEVWNSVGTVVKGLSWMLSRDAPLLLNPLPTWHKYTWIAEFLSQIPNYRKNTIATTKLALAARKHLFEIAEREGIEFDLERRGILHVYRTGEEFQKAKHVNLLLQEGGLERYAVTADEIKQIEPCLNNQFFAGFFTPSDATGDIHKFTQGLAEVCDRMGGQFLYDTTVNNIEADSREEFTVSASQTAHPIKDLFSHVVICAGVASRHFAAMLGDRVNIYPVKGYSITVCLDDQASQDNAPWVSLLDENYKIVTSRLGLNRFRVAGTAEINGLNRDIRHERIKPLIAWTRSNFPFVKTDQVIPWAGLRPMLPSMLPRTGRGARAGVFYNTGHGHLGWTLSAATAELVADCIIGREV
jgi:D-amino-acid dehydrogenase